MLRYRFSLRSLLIGLAAVCVVLGLSIRFGPHVLWKTIHSDIASGVDRIPSKPLISVLPDIPLVTCRFGPITFALPDSLSKNVEVGHILNHGKVVCFKDEHRDVTLQVPYRWEGYYSLPEIEDFPEQSNWTSPRLLKAICEAASSDFSFLMSQKELRWHKYLLNQRSLSSSDVKSIEYLLRQDVEATLTQSGTVWMFSWSTIDRKWSGNVLFHDRSNGKKDWIHHFCTTFILAGNMAIFEGLYDDRSIKSLIKVSVHERITKPPRKHLPQIGDGHTNLYSISAIANERRIYQPPRKRPEATTHRRETPKQRRSMNPTQVGTLLLLHSACRSETAKGRSKSEKRHSAAGFASPPAESHSSPISTFDGTLFLDMSLETLPSEDSVAMRLTSTSAVKGTFFDRIYQSLGC